MAKMHSRKRGKSGSKRPTNLEKPTWVRFQDKELELLIFKLAKEGKTSSQIGLALRDLYGVPSSKAVLGKKITAVMKDKNLLKKIPEDLTALIRRSLEIRKHLEKNAKDIPAVRGLQLTESKIKRLIKYYKRSGKLAPDWKYDPKQISLYIE